MTYDQIMAETVARLEAERYAPLPALPVPAHLGPPRRLTPDEQAENRQALLDALSDDPVVVAFRERQAG